MTNPTKQQKMGEGIAYFHWRVRMQQLHPDWRLDEFEWRYRWVSGDVDG